jgi:hypothetical protein
MVGTWSTSGVYEKWTNNFFNERNEPQLDKEGENIKEDFRET